MTGSALWVELFMRILVADDEAGIIAAYKICLEKEDSTGTDALNSLGDSLFGESEPSKAVAADGWTDVTYVTQGEQVVAAVKSAVAAGEPYGVLFLDMRMPPGMDGRDTAKLVRQIDAEINIVIVTGYSDHSPLEVARVAGPQDKLYYLAKPFETDEIRTMAASLSAKWKMENDLKEAHQALEQKFAELEAAQVEIQASEARCRHIALHDQLTRLPNRVYFQNFLNEALADRQDEVSILFIDLDRFKLVNDTFGHGAGDELICELSERLARVLPDGSLFARLGGDEFGIVLTGEAAGRSEAVAQELVDLSNVPFEILGSKVQVGASIGLAVRGASNCNGSELLRRADLALYAAKEQGRNCVRLFIPGLDDSARKRSEIDTKLRAALESNSLTLVYQPIVDPFENAPIGYEALVRWTDPELGTVSPTIFVPIAEETGLILALGEWVVRNAIKECASWPSGVVSINLSTRHFQSPSMIEFLCRTAAENGLSHDRIQLEITETALFDDTSLAAEILIELRKRGIRIALDDFGTGYSSLVNLKDFEIDCIKIDQSFVATLGSDRQSSAIVTAVTSLARNLGLRVVAEGVESEMQVQALRLVGCELMQGYFYSKPMEANALPYLQSDSDDYVALAEKQVASKAA
jgi:diguanylate cyclase (GGDEF)-like protein